VAAPVPEESDEEAGEAAEEAVEAPVVEEEAEAEAAEAEEAEEAEEATEANEMRWRRWVRGEARTYAVIIRCEHSAIAIADSTRLSSPTFPNASRSQMQPLPNEAQTTTWTCESGRWRKARDRLHVATRIGRGA
jgi:hypothetical protein